MLFSGAVSERELQPGSLATEDQAIRHLEALRHDIRGEIKQRIEQRDRYSIQLTIALSVIVGLAFSQTGFDRALIAAPLVSIYFTILILYSYKVHGVLAGYLRDTLEPEMARRCAIPPEAEWEAHYARHEVPGIRRRFFVTTLWAVSVLSMAYLFVSQRGDAFFLWVLAVASVVYLIACILVTRTFGS